MKWMGYGMVFFASLSGGFYASMLLEKRRTQLLSLKRAAAFLSREIDYRLSTLSEAFLHTAGRIDEPWKSFFKKAGESMENPKPGSRDFETMWGMLVRDAEKIHPWKKDLHILTNLGQGLGQLDKKMQLAALMLAEEELSAAQLDAGEECKKKGHLYRMLGALMGMLAVILLL